MSNNRIWLSSPTMHGEEQKYIKEAFDTNWVAPLGKNVNEFENEMCGYLGIKSAAAMTAGTHALHMAVKLADIKEGETGLTDIWFEYNALKMAKERGLGDDIQGEALEKLIDEAWETCPPPKAIDFRMSFSRRNRYRVQA